MKRSSGVAKVFRNLVASVICVIVSLHVFAQSPYIPRNIAKAYQKQTRSIDGNPGKNYWQNHAKYVIDIEARPPSRTVRGKEKIRYFNNSPDTLRTPSLKVFVNIHKPGATRDGNVDKRFLNDGVTIDKLFVNGTSVTVNNESVFTDYSFRLPKALAPKDSTSFDIEWHYEISLRDVREGLVDSTTFFLGLFYPRIAVFDDYSGWDRTSYTSIREFYSDFNDYDISLHVPKNFVVWGTGTLIQPEKLLQPNILDRYLRSKTSDNVIHIISQKDLDSKAVTTQNETNTWRFTSTHIPDVAYGIGNHYVWDAASVAIGNGKRVTAEMAYTSETEEYTLLTAYSCHAVKWFSNNWPGVAFPYEKVNIFQTTGEMEYPMMVKGSAYKDTTMAKFVAAHEIVHNYMPFYMGTNETRHGFMDEGWATTFELLIGASEKGAEQAEKFFQKFRVLGWLYDSSPGEDVPIITPTDNVIGSALGDNEYGKPALGFLALKDYLGDALFKKCLHAYMNRWHGKHPIPWDMFFTFNDVSGQNLNWFWNSWFFSNYYMDLSIESVKPAKKEWLVAIRNIGGIPSPVNITITYHDGTSETLHQTPAIWQHTPKEAIIKVPTSKRIKSVSLDGGIFMDTDTRNNTMDL